MLRKHFNKEKRLYQLIYYAKRRNVTSPLFLTEFTEMVSMDQVPKVHKASILYILLHFEPGTIGVWVLREETFYTSYRTFGKSSSFVK